MDQNKNNPQSPSSGDKRPKVSIWIPILITIGIILLITTIFNLVRDSQYTETSFSHFMEAREAGQLDEVLIEPDRIVYMTKEEAAKPAQDQKAFFTGLPEGDILTLLQELYAEGVTSQTEIPEDNSFITTIKCFKS